MKSVPYDELKAFIEANAVEIPGEIPVSSPTKLVLRWPAPDPKIVNQRYGINKQFYAPFGLPGHEGIDIRALNATQIVAMADGKVSRVEHVAASGAYGIHVRVKHDLGPELLYESVYAHFKSTAVALGDVVQAGQLLGLADNTGNSSGAHLHITLKHYGHGSPWMNKSDIVNPTPYMPDLFPGKGWLTDILGNIRATPDDNGQALRAVPANSLVKALDFGGVGGDWWKIEFQSTVGWYWNPGYKLRLA